MSCHSYPHNDKAAPREVAQALSAHILALVQEILPAGKRQRQEWVVGSVAGEPGSSLSIHLSGAKAGIWADFSAGLRGDALDLVAEVCCAGDKKAAYKWGLSWLGWSNDNSSSRRTAPVRRVSEAEIKKKAEKEAAERQKRITEARAMWLSAKPLSGQDPASLYLKNRGIDVFELQKIPGALRFSLAHYCAEIRQEIPAMLSAIFLPDGKQVATHRTFLEKKNGIWQKASLKSPKKIYGPFSGGFVPLQKGASGKTLAKASQNEFVFLGEGIETCLSVALAFPKQRVLAACSLGNLGAIAFPENIKNIVILADNDKNAQAIQALERSTVSLSAGGKRNIYKTHSSIGKDFNDAIK